MEVGNLPQWNESRKGLHTGPDKRTFIRQRLPGRIVGNPEVEPGKRGYRNSGRCPQVRIEDVNCFCVRLPELPAEG